MIYTVQEIILHAHLLKECNTGKQLAATVAKGGNEVMRYYIVEQLLSVFLTSSELIGTSVTVTVVIEVVYAWSSQVVYSRLYKNHS